MIAKGEYAAVYYLLEQKPELSTAVDAEGRTPWGVYRARGRVFPWLSSAFAAAEQSINRKESLELTRRDLEPWDPNSGSLIEYWENEMRKQDESEKLGFWREPRWYWDEDAGRVCYNSVR